MQRIAAALQFGGMAAGIAAGFVIDTAVGLIVTSVACLVTGIALERRQ